jgi:dephospho-CoA kinase
LVPSDPAWPEQAARIVGRLNTTCGHRASRLDHIGSTSVPGLDAKDVIDIQVTVASLEVADELEDSLVTAGYPRIGHIATDEPKADARSTVSEFDRTGSDDVWRKRIHAAADPGRPANIHLRVDGWPNQQFALLFRDWLRANPAERDGYVSAKRAALATPDYAEAKEPWFLGAYQRAWEWADSTGWRP